MYCSNSTTTNTNLLTQGISPFFLRATSSKISRQQERASKEQQLKQILIKTSKRRNIFGTGNRLKRYQVGGQVWHGAARARADVCRTGWIDDRLPSGCHGDALGRPCCFALLAPCISDRYHNYCTQSDNPASRQSPVIR